MTAMLPDITNAAAAGGASTGALVLRGDPSGEEPAGEDAGGAALARYLSKAEVQALAQPVRYIPRAPKLPKAVRHGGAGRRGSLGKRIGKQKHGAARRYSRGGHDELAVPLLDNPEALPDLPQARQEQVEAIDDLDGAFEGLDLGGVSYSSQGMRSRMQFVNLLHKIKADPVRYSSAVLLSEVLMRQAHVATRGLPAPNALRTAVACFSFDIVTSQLGDSYRHALHAIRREIFPAIFTDSTFDDGQLVQMSNLAVGSPLQYSIGTEAATVHRYMGCPLTFECLRDLKADLGQYKQTCDVLAVVNGKSLIVVKRSIDKWMKSSLCHCFAHWKLVIATTRRNKWLQRKEKRRYDDMMKKYVLQAAWGGWKALAKTTAVKRLQERAATLIYQLDNSNNQFTLQCFKTERYLTVIDQLRGELERVGDDLTKEKIKNSDASALLNVEHDRKIAQITSWLRDLEQQMSAFMEYSDKLLALTAHTDVPDRRVGIEALVADARALLGTPGDARKKSTSSAAGKPGKSPPPSELMVLAWAAGVVARCDMFDPPRSVTNFGHDWADGLLFVVVMNHVAPSVCHLYPMQEINKRKRMQHVVRYARALQFTGIPSAEDLLHGATDQVFLLLAELFERYVDRDAARVEHNERLQREAEVEAKRLAEEAEARAAEALLEAQRLAKAAAAAGAKPGSPRSPRKAKVLRDFSPMSSPKSPLPFPDGAADRAPQSEALLEASRSPAQPASPTSGHKPRVRRVSLPPDETPQTPPDPPAVPEENSPTASESERGGMTVEQLPAFVEQVKARLAKVQDTQDRAAGEAGRWDAVTTGVRQKVVEVSAARAAGRAIVVVDNREVAKYTKIGKPRLKDLARNFSATAQQAVNQDAPVYTFDQMVEHTAALCRECFQDLRTVFQHYASRAVALGDDGHAPASAGHSTPDDGFRTPAQAQFDTSAGHTISSSSAGAAAAPSGGAAPTMTLSGWWRMACDMRCIDHTHLNKHHVLTTFKRVQPHTSSVPGGGGGDAEADDAGLGPAEFVEALIRLADLRVPSDPTLQGRLRCFLHQFCFPYAARPGAVAPGREWRADVYAPSTQELLDRYHRDLVKVHTFYSAPQTGPHAATHAPACTASGFARLLSDANILGDGLSEADAQQCFRHSQGPLEAGGAGDSDLVYQEFAEALVACALFKHPSPFVPLARRVEHLVTHALVAIRAKMKQSGIKLDTDVKAVSMHG